MFIIRYVVLIFCVITALYILFNYDNLEFKTINHPTPHRFIDLCPEFKLKQIKKLAGVAVPLSHLAGLKVYKHKTSFHVNLPVLVCT